MKAAKTDLCVGGAQLFFCVWLFIEAPPLGGSLDAKGSLEIFHKIFIILK